jgi:aminoglycoside 6'-N-acetyltransferase-1b
MLIRRDNLTVRAAVPADAKLLGGWWRDGDIMKFSGYPEGMDITDEAVEKQILSCSDDTFRLLILELDGEPVGELDYHVMDCKTVQTGIKICDAKLRGKGLGTRFMRLLLSELFGAKGFARIILDVAHDNIPARRMYEKCGFRERSQTPAVVYYELTKDEFLKQKTDV